jgi:hypothetical protein
VTTTTTDTRIGYYVIFFYKGPSETSRETTVYLSEGQNFSDAARIISDGDIRKRDVVMLSLAPLGGLTRERADEMRAIGKAWDRARFA